ncbi:hypothetical protein CPB83DRAFT_855057 [Crepidotus variabilis]|uniref:Uncharacterized protein n=1 Tax=Crepidotus variabilis TaxID=179855 RepID=A0A9P6EFS1_9AGAR|nr:hypothetical protein CPB83DRAFT_855057 [Crepidotus variabilis]
MGPGLQCFLPLVLHRHHFLWHHPLSPLSPSTALIVGCSLSCQPPQKLQIQRSCDILTLPWFLRASGAFGGYA